MEEYELVREIGKGSYGCVFVACNRRTGKTYAVKRIRVVSTSHYERSCIVNELRVLSAHTCPFIVAFKTAYFADDHVHIVTEYASNGDLARLLRDTKDEGERLTVDRVWNVFLQLCIAVTYLHSIHVIHRDLKPANVFLDADHSVKLGDVGVAKIMRSYLMYGQTQVGTPLYMSPEIMKRERYDAKTDVWSMGCILYETMALAPAFVAHNMNGLRHQVSMGKVNLECCERYYPTTLCSLVPLMLSVNPRSRPPAATLLRREGVKREVERRMLDTFVTPSPHDKRVKPGFHAQCLVPRRMLEWNRVMQELCLPEDTVRLDVATQQRMDAMIRNASSSVSTEEEIARVEEMLVKARRYVVYLEEKLETLKKKGNGRPS